MPEAVIRHIGARSEAPGRAKNVWDKIRSLEELAEISAREKEVGGTVVLAHGVFDLLHLGHVRHLKQAHEHGTLLIVTITPDRFVNKGPGRPIFKEILRAEMLATLEYVDYVAINTGPTAGPVLDAVMPDVYVKGSEYADPTQDVTGKIKDERQAVERGGGSMVFTEDITFSSSELINRHFNVFEPKTRAFLDNLRDGGHRERILEAIERLADLRVLVVGETIIDEYRYVQPMSKTPKENLIATLHQSVEVFAGGAIATANHLASLVKEVEVITLYGAQDTHADFVQGKLKPNVRIHPVLRGEGPTTRKCRYVDPAQMRKLFEVYYMNDAPLEDAYQEELNRLLSAMAGDFDAVIVNDFGHSMIMPSSVKCLVEGAKFLALNAQTNSANYGYNLISKYPHADYVCIDHAEARLAVRDQHASIEDILKTSLVDLIPAPNVIVTKGKDGCCGYTAGEPTVQVPAFTDHVVDTVGAGDAFLSVTAPLMATGADLLHTAFVGNIAGALKVGIVGHRNSIDKVALVKSVTALLK